MNQEKYELKMSKFQALLDQANKENNQFYINKITNIMYFFKLGYEAQQKAV